LHGFLNWLHCSANDYIVRICQHKCCKSS